MLADSPVEHPPDRLQPIPSGVLLSQPCPCRSRDIPGAGINTPPSNLLSIQNLRPHPKSKSTGYPGRSPPFPGGTTPPIRTTRPHPVMTVAPPSTIPGRGQIGQGDQPLQSSYSVCPIGASVGAGLRRSSHFEGYVVSRASGIRYPVSGRRGAGSRSP